ncbi:carbon-nitrogen hydrolase [Rhodococcus sp. 05-2255-3B1]|uniref:carbon-nitrogen hydrolase family protein n=1 Tax=unclassified Rhodococcus (in: high G+C Gram-positive bacteria) TaxID=192944 RepID=UPI000B9AE730|nr:MULTISPECIES: carbon-nitrogen hydrolase family protein [unclassified Rhodococcus (in: high G+C Gram-positive bacteria)]OZE08791.1 carbon-nitrogen hydrolase [Rhodococcus sp. 05-2255-3B1]OZE10131.1 carbon-nitrogen hydrolase [Rhodococcus sp. 05-2255-3C]OZE25252.1 carbon-nitrogen hydrolase [Rhodococcus sp. 05-2255-2A2]
MTVTVSLYQGPELAGDVHSNLAALDDAARNAAAAGASILVTPEMSVSGYDIGDLVLERAEPFDGPIFEKVSTIARSHGLAIVYGYPERSRSTLGGEVVFNAVQVVDASGRSVARYRKTHLFGELDRAHFTPGSELLVQFDFGGLRCGLLTCYDVEFPETVRAHADAGTQWLIVPTGLMTPFEIIATHVVPTRAYESQLFVTYVNRCGTEASLTYCGLTCAVAPGGTDLARAGAHEQLLTVVLDPAELLRSRAVNTHLDDRRHDLYRTVLDPTGPSRSEQETDR